MGGAEADRSTLRDEHAMHAAAANSCNFTLPSTWQNLGAEAAARTFRIWPTCSLENCGAGTPCSCRHAPKPKLTASCQAPRLRRFACVSRVPGLTHPRVSPARRTCRSVCGRDVLGSPLRGQNAERDFCIMPIAVTVRTEPFTCSARPPNGSEVNPRGQGPRGYGSAAHGLPACESRDAGRAPP